jgi:putative membrane protein
MRHQLRGTDPRADFERLLSQEDVACLARKQFKPITILLMAGEWLRERRMRGQIEAPLAQVMEMHLDRLGEAIGGCERIATTPIPFTYGVILHRVTYLYSVLLPFGLIDSIGPMTPVIVAFISYTFFALEAVSAEIEEPFGLEPNDLALDAMSETIEQSLREILHRQHTARVRAREHHIIT